jgi:hypothetical protein
MRFILVSITHFPENLIQLAPEKTGKKDMT